MHHEEAIRDALREGRTPQLYLDSGVVLDLLRPERKEASVELLRESYARGWECISSYFARMEALDVEQENAWARRNILSKRHFEWIVRRRRKRDLAPQALTRIANRFFRRFVDELQNAVAWAVLDEQVWDDAVKLAATTNVSATDCIHIATAMAFECDVLVTDDEGLIGLAGKHIAAANPQQMLKTVKKVQAQS